MLSIQYKQQQNGDDYNDQKTTTATTKSCLKNRLNKLKNSFTIPIIIYLIFVVVHWC